MNSRTLRRLLLVFSVHICSSGAQDNNIICTIHNQMTASSYQLSENAASSIVHKGGDTQDSFQAFHCTCPTEEIGYLEDNSEVSLFNADPDLTKAGEYDWKNSSVFLVKDCADLVISFGRNQNSFASSLKGAALILENIDLLEINNLDATRRGRAVNLYDDTFSSIHLRNVFLEKVPSTVYIEDKVEVTLHKLRLKDGVGLHLEVSNTDSEIDPVLIVENCTFSPPADVSNGIINEAVTFSLSMVNEQKKVDSNTKDNVTPCQRDYKGMLKVQGNSIGILDSEGISVKGGGRVEIVGNQVDMINQNGLSIMNAKAILLEGNHFKFPMAFPLTKIEFVKDDTNACVDPDLPFTDIDQVHIKKNKYPHMKKGLVSAISTAYEEDEDIMSKFTFVNNSATSACDCGNVTIDSEAAMDRAIHKSLMSSSHCLAAVDGFELEGQREDICDGKLPETPKHAQERLTKEVRNQWTIWVIVAALVSALLSGAATAIIMKVCCDGKMNQVTPRE